MGDVAAADAAAGLAAEAWRLAAPARLRVGMNALYRSGDVVLRVGRPSTDPALGLALAHRLADLGIAGPLPARGDVVQAGGLAVTAWRYVAAGGAPVDWRAVGRIVRRVHALERRDLPAGYPLPAPSAFPWWDFDAMLAEVDDLLDGAAREGLAATIERHRGWQDATGAVVCHGDVHPGNVLQAAGGPVLLDWDLLCRAPPGWDHAMLLTLAGRWGGDPAVYPAFAAGYGRDLSADPGAVRLAELRNVAATLMRVRAGRTDPSARAEAERRLRFWRGDPEAPMWAAQ